jgi:hypothetical protein
VPQRSVIQAGRWRVVLVDSITQIAPDDAGSIAVSGSHGGTSSADFAAEVPLALAVFNDAGIGKDEAGVAGLAQLEAQGRAAAAVSHLTARIGDAADAWENGVISRVNAGAAKLGLRVGKRLRESVERIER